MESTDYPGVTKKLLPLPHRTETDEAIPSIWYTLQSAARELGPILVSQESVITHWLNSYSGESSFWFHPSVRLYRSVALQAEVTPTGELCFYPVLDVAFALGLEFLKTAFSKILYSHKNITLLNSNFSWKLTRFQGS